jgi:hypothetical protein
VSDSDIQLEGGALPGTTTTFELPRSGSLTLKSAADAVARLAREGGWGPSVLIRVVALLDTHGWALVGALAEPNVTLAPCSPAVERAGPLAFIRSVVSLSQFCHRMQDCLQAWRTVVTPPASAVGLENGVNVQPRFAGARTGDPPQHSLVAYEIADFPIGTSPRGPFVGREGQFVATTLGDALAQWLELDDKQLDAPSRQYVVRLVDRRAYFRDARSKGLSVTIEVESAVITPLHLAVDAVLFDETLLRFRRPVIDGLCTIELPQAAASISVFLVGADGTCFDRFDEFVGRRRGRFDVLMGESEPLSPLREALNAGEGEAIEFKAWVPIERENPKSIELLRTICAFANTHGGQLFIGVADDLTVVGTSKYLFELYTKSGVGLEECQVRYLRALQRIVNDGLSPPVSVAFEWVTLAGIHVLACSVLASSSLHHIVETNAVVIRRGSNSVNASPAELSLLLRRSSSAVGVVAPGLPRL